MKKYVKPAAEVEKFTVADIITASTPTFDGDIGELSADLDAAVAPSTGDEF